MTEPYHPKPCEIAGFEILGYVQPDGKLRLGNEKHGTVVAEFPPEVRVCGATYTLERVKKTKRNPKLQWGEYV